MARLYVRHRVEDYDSWRQGYDDFAAKRSELGATDDAVYRSVEDPNDVTVWHDFDSAETARSFVGSEELRSAMENAGVAGEPQIWITEKA